MKAPVKWLLAYTDIKNINTDAEIHDFAGKLTLSGSKVETVDKLTGAIQNVVLGKCLEIVKHPNSDHMFICQIDVGAVNGGVKQIVTGAQNMRVGAFVPAALDGAVVSGGKVIKNGKLRGEESDGMLCCFAELDMDCAAYGGDNTGITILQDLQMFKDYDEAKFDSLIGTDIMDVFGLSYSDTVIDFEITSNRADCFSILGLSREAAITMGGKFLFPELKVKEEAPEKTSDVVKVTVEDKKLCPAYYARAVKNVKIGPSPKWMRDRLEASGVRAINNIVDITNYVMLEFGQPMHSFDARTIRGNHIIVRHAADGEVFRTLDGQDRTLNSKMLVIADSEGTIGIAGVMGGENSEIEPDTTDVVFESAIFDGVTVRRGAKSVGLRTEASSRFEKGLDPVMARKAIDRAAMLVEMLGCGDVLKGVIEEEGEIASAPVIPFVPENINRFIGIDATEAEMVDILTQLECVVDTEKHTVTPPSFRGDLKGFADISEEVARFYGYNNIKSSLLKDCEMTLGKKTKAQMVKDLIRKTVSDMGFSEMLTYSFESPTLCDKLNAPADSALRNQIRIRNPLGEEFSAMRTSMIPTAMKVLSYNNAQRNPEASLFEISYIYIKSEDEEKLPEHREQLTLCSYGKFDFFGMKGCVEALFDELKITGIEYEPVTDNPSLHPGRAAKILQGGKEIGIIAQIHPLVADKFEAPRDSYVAILDVAPLAESCQLTPKSKEMPKFPAVTRDLAVVVDKSVPVGHIEKIIRQRGGKLLESCSMFDVYEGSQLSAGKKSVAYSLSFRDANATLTDDDVAKPMKKILNGLETILGAELR